MSFFFFFQAEDGIRDKLVTGVQTCALPISLTVPGSSASAPRWSPDGRYVSFLAARKTGAPGDSEPKTQVWALDRRGGEARPLTHVPQGVEAYEWSPDGSKLVLVIRDTFPTWTSSKAARPWVITRLQFKRDEVRSEEHTSELQSLAYLVCRLLLEKKKTKKTM